MHIIHDLGRSRLSVALVAALSATLATASAAQSPAAATSQNNDDASDGAKRIEAVQVIGSRIKRTQVEGPSPVTVITAEQIRAEGFNTVQDVLETLSQNTGTTQNDFNAAGGFTPNAGVINLRGMGPGRTLLLINGRRANDYPFPYNGRSNVQNFNNIPAGAVDRIEVLAGGASAIYGSDAVAGVINVVLKTNFEGNQLSLKAQTSTQGGRDIGDLQWVGGKTGDRWSLTYAFEAYSSEPLWAWQRDFMDSAADNPAPPGLNGAAGVGGYQPPIGIQIRRQSATGATLGYLLPTGRDCSASSFYRPHTYTSSVSGATFGPGCGYDRSPAEQTVANGNDDVSAYLYGTFDINDELQAWASFMTFDSKAKLSGGVEQWFGGPQPQATFYDPSFGMRIYPIRTLTTEAYGGPNGTFQRFDETSYDLAFGLKGAFNDRFDWDLTIGGARYEAYRQRPRLTVAGATAYFLGDRLGTTGVGPYIGLAGIPNNLPVYRLNLDRFYGVITPADYAAMSTTVTYDAVAKNAAATFVVTGSLLELPAGDLGMAAVAEASTQSYTLDTDRRLLPDRREIYNLTGTGGGGDRNRYALGVEFSIPLLDTLTMSLAGRFDRYDDITDVDDAKTWNGGLEWRPLDTLLVRGSFATSFKAPDMHYVFAERSGSFGTVTDFARCARDGIAPNVCGGAGANYNYSVFTTSQGQPTLEEETGESWTAGVVWDITDQLSATVDYYQIDLKNVITVRSGTDILGDEYGCTTGRYPNQSPFPFAAGSDYCNAVLARISRDPASDNRLTEVRSGPINLAFQGTKGIDASLRYRWDAGDWGAFSANLAWSHVLEQTDRATPAAALRSYRDLNINADFRSRLRATLGWAKEDWNATLFMNRLGTFPIWDPTNTRAVSGELDSRIAAFTTYNLTIGHQVTDDWGMTLSIVNLFDKNYPADPTFNSFPYFWRAYDAIGRQVGIEATYTF
jgi:iron complex outermembrane receptor protein